jgi:hypothetical protein
MKYIRTSKPCGKPPRSIASEDIVDLISPKYVNGHTNIGKNNITPPTTKPKK